MPTLNTMAGWQPDSPQAVQAARAEMGGLLTERNKALLAKRYTTDVDLHRDPTTSDGGKPPTTARMKTLKQIWNYALSVAPQVVRTPLDPLYAYRGWNIDRFLLTIGYNRSGSSLLGQLLNAHPEIVISHECLLQQLRALRFVPTLSQRGRVTRLILQKDRQAMREESYRETCYSYAINGLWQGRYSRLRVIGNKRSRYNSIFLGMPGTKDLDRLRRCVRVPMLFLFNVRNPYDILASRRLNLLRNQAHADIPALRVYAPTDSERIDIREEDVRWFFDLSENISRVLAIIPEESTLPMRYEEFIASPKEMLRRACAFLGVICDDNYLDACAAFTLQTPHPTRLKVRWSDAQIAQIAAAIAKYPWLAGYDFDS